MKLKRLLAGFIAVAMTIGMIPALAFADEAENGTKEPAAVEETEAKEEEKKPAVKETKPAESKAEEPAEKEDKKEAEPAETEAPAETEEKQPAESKEAEPSDKQPAESEDKAEPAAPAEKPDTVTGKIPGDSDSSTPKKAPIKIGKIEGISLEGSVDLKWNAYPGTVDYAVAIDNYDFGDSFSSSRINNIHTYINNAIKNGQLRKSTDNTYTVTVYAFNDDGMLIAKGSAKHNFGSTITATEPTVGNVPNAKINKKGILHYDKDYHESEASYQLYINNLWSGYAYDEEGEGINLKERINELIRNNFLAKPSNNKYTILLTVTNNDGKVVQRYSTTYTYKTSAKPAQTYTFENVRQEKGRLKFDAIKGAKKYIYYIYEQGVSYSFDFGVATTNSIDVNNKISQFIDEGMKRCSSYFIELAAYDGNGTVLAMCSKIFDFEIEPNPLSVKGKTAKVKYSKLKKKKQTLKASQVINGVATGRGKMIYTKQSGNKNITINKSTGTVTIKKKGLKKGKTYSVKVMIFAAGNNGYDPSDEKLVTFKIKVTK